MNTSVITLVDKNDNIETETIKSDNISSANHCNSRNKDSNLNNNLIVNNNDKQKNHLITPSYHHHHHRHPLL